MFGQAPLVAVAWLAWFTGHGGAGDFAIFRRAGDAVLHGHSPYVRPTLEALAQNDRFVYPMPFAYPFVPLALLGQRPGAVVFLVLSAAAIAASLRLLGVRDWRLYGLALIGIPAFGALALGAIGPFLLLLVAAGWRLRRSAWAGVPLAVAAAAKLFLWPLLIWLLVTRRFRAFGAAMVTLATVLAVWAAADPSGLARYPETVRLLNLAQRWKSYSPQTLWMSLGLPAAELVPILLAVAGIVLLVLVRSDRRSFALAVVVSLVASPILWLHYLVLLFVPLALARPRLGPMWLVPFALWATPHPESLGSIWRITVVLAAIAVVATLDANAGAEDSSDASKARLRPVLARFRGRPRATAPVLASARRSGTS